MSIRALYRVGWLAMLLISISTLVAQTYTEGEEGSLDTSDELQADDAGLSTLDPVSITIEDPYWEEEYIDSDVQRAELNYAQVDYRALGEIDFEEIVERRTYEQEEIEIQEELPSINYNTEGMKTFSLVIATIFVIALFVGILYYWQKNRVDTDVDIHTNSYSVTDELLSASTDELNDALSQNLTNKNYKDAIRYRFGQILSKLRDNGLLEWVPGKTNADYERELIQPLSISFHELAKAFNFAYYSGRPVTEGLFLEFDEKAKSFEKSILNPSESAPHEQ